MPELTVDAERFLRNGQPHQVISGAMHYFRVHPDLWADRMSRLRAMGLNTLETYVAWNVHERLRGEADFTGWNDLPRFLRLAGEAGLDVILRPGPYICAEWDFGGLPAWLLADGVLPAGAGSLRTSDPAYLLVVDQWLDVLIPRVLPLLATQGGPVVAVQVENEYGSFGDDPAYLEHLRDGLVRRGVDVLLVTSDGPTPDMLASGSVPGVLATANFGSGVHDSFAVLAAAQPGRPLMCMEFWDGWFDHWGEAHHVREPAEAALALQEVLARGASINIYLAHGGTNFGLWSGANAVGDRHQPTVTSYDYAAPISEAGELTPAFHAFREVIGRYAELPAAAEPSCPARLTPRTARTRASLPLLECVEMLGRAQSAPMPMTMEQLSQDHGMVHYRARVLVPRDGAPLSVVGLRDRATVLADGAVVGVLERNRPGDAVTLFGTGAEVTIDLLVENQGRINYGTQLGERKGVTGGVRLGQRWIHSWTSRPLRLDSPDFIGLLPWTRAQPAARADGADPRQGPSFHRAHIWLDEPADGFLATPGWGKGFVWLGGFLLGRYWSIGPQQTLYAPAPLWQRGSNEIVVLELESAGDSVELCAEARLGTIEERGTHP